MKSLARSLVPLCCAASVACSGGERSEGEPSGAPQSQAPRTVAGDARSPRRLADDPNVKPYTPEAPAPLDFSGVDVGDAPMEDASESLEALGERIVAGLIAKDEDALSRASLTEAEYTQRFFPALIHHRNALKMGAALSWSELSGESSGDLGTALQRHGGTAMTFVRVDVEDVDERPKVRLHRRPTIVVTSAAGEQHLSIIGSIVEHVPSGGFKVLAFRDTP